MWITGHGSRTDVGHTLDRMHFGRLLKTLREARTLTQRELADRAGISEQSVRRGEWSATCPWKRSTCIKAMTALNKERALSPHETQDFSAAAGIQDMIDAGAALRAVIAAATPKGILAHAHLDALIDAIGTDKVLATLAAVAASHNATLPATIPSESGNPGPRALVHDTVESGYRIRTFAPVTPPASTPPRPAKPARRRRAE